MIAASSYQFVDSLPEDKDQIFASKYKLYMPTKDELKRELAKEQELFETEKHLQEEE